MTLTQSQLQTLTAICDAFLPSIAAEPDDEHYWARAASDLRVAQQVAESIAQLPVVQDHKNFAQLLGLFDSRIANLFLCGRPLRFSRLAPRQREQYLRDWANSRLALKRQGFQALKRLATLSYFSTPDESGRNPNWSTLQYPGPLRESLHTSGLPSSAPKPIKPIDTLQLITRREPLACDVVVVGSGAGGSVIAAELAAAGKTVIVVERGGYLNESDFNQSENDMSRRLFWDQARLVTQDSAVSLLAGSCLGGGTTVNWCGSFRPPQGLRERWEHEHGLSGVAGAEFDTHIEAVSARLCVGKGESLINAQNDVLRRGCVALNYHVDSIARNVSGCGDGSDCGYCTFGCVRGAKQSTLLTYLQDAHQYGAQFIINAEAQRVLIENGRAVGIEILVLRDHGAGHLTPTKQLLTVRAKAVVAAGGSIGTPALLLRSGLQNPNIGRHLHLHPTTFMLGIYDEPIEAWQGVPMSIVCDQFSHLNDGYGFALETPPIHTSVPAAVIPWTSGQAYKAWMAQLAHTAAFIVLTKDRDGGRVTINKAGQPRVAYWLSEFDRAHMIHGMQSAARVHIAAGAREVYSTHAQPAIWQRGAPFEPFIAQLAQARCEPNRLLVGSAHQMSTCRMGRDPQTSVADTQGQVHGVVGLWIGDASAFPTASGVNPMITIMSLAHRTAGFIRQSL